MTSVESYIRFYNEQKDNGSEAPLVETVHQMIKDVVVIANERNVMDDDSLCKIILEQERVWKAFAASQGDVQPLGFRLTMATDLPEIYMMVDWDWEKKDGTNL